MADRFDEITAQSQVRRFCCNDDDDDDGGVGDDDDDDDDNDDGGVGDDDDDDNDDDTPGADYPKSGMFLSADGKSAGACSEVTILRDRLHHRYFFMEYL